MLPFPLGFSWHVRNEEGYLEYTLESTATYGEMLVLMIRRKGEFRLRHYYHYKKEYPHEYLVRREGVSAYAINRSIVLEDRTHDVYLSNDPESKNHGVETWNAHRLIKSVLNAVVP